MTFTLKKDGQTVATFKDGASSFETVDGTDVYDITGVTTDTKLTGRLGAPVSYSSPVVNPLKTSELVEKEPLLVSHCLHDSERIGLTYTVRDEAQWEELMVSPNSDIYFGYLDSKKYEVVDEMTVPAGKFVLSVSDAYANRGDTTTKIQLMTPRDDWDDENVPVTEQFLLSENAGTKLIDLPTGSYVMGLGGYNIFSRDINVSSESRKYIKIRIPAKELPLDLNDDLTVTETSTFYEVNTRNFPIGNAVTDEDGTVVYLGYAFSSGAVATADIPDADGYIEVWTPEDDPYIEVHTRYVPGYAGGSTGSIVSLSLEFVQVNTETIYPESGLTLYNVSSGEYTVELDSTEYVLEQNAFTLTDTADMQKIDLKVSAVPASSSSSETSSESSSEASSSESGLEARSSSSESSSEASSSSSSAASSSSSSSAASSSSSSIAASSKAAASSTASANNNPATGAAGTGIAAVGAPAAAIVVSKKKKN